MKWVVPGVVARGKRPGYAKDANRVKTVDREAVDRWMGEAQGLRIRGILCLLEDPELALYDYLPGGLRGYYQSHGVTMEHTPLTNHSAPTEAQLEEIWSAYGRLPSPVLVHCSGGEGRTGVVAAYLQERLAPARALSRR